MSALLLERLQFVMGIAPIADAHAGGVASDVIDVSPFSRLVFVSIRGVATGGTAAPTYTVQACDDIVPTTTSAVAFKYRKSLGAVETATTTGFQATAGSAAIDVIEIGESALAELGYQYARLAIAETVNDPVVATVLVFGELKQATSGTYETVTD